MPTLTLIIIFGSLFIAVAATALILRKTHPKLFRTNRYGYISDFPFCSMATLVLLFVMLSAFILSGVQEVEEDTIRILDREGEPFDVLTSGTHYTAEFDSYGESNLDCSPQISEASESITLESGNGYLVTADLTWQLECTPFNALRAWRYLENTHDGVNLEEQLFNNYITYRVSPAIETCTPNGIEHDRIVPPKEIAKYYTLLGGNCVAANTQARTGMIRVLGFSNWNAKYFSLPVDAPNIK